MMPKLFQEALNINAPWFIKSIEFDPEKKHLDIYIDFKRGATFIGSFEDQVGKQLVLMSEKSSLPVIR